MSTHNANSTVESADLETTNALNASELTRFQRDLLIVTHGLNDSDTKISGADIRTELNDYYATSINHGRLYPNLDELIAEDLLVKKELDGRTNYYELTEKGRNTLKARRDWENRYLF